MHSAVLKFIVLMRSFPCIDLLYMTTREKSTAAQGMIRLCSTEDSLKKKVLYITEVFIFVPTVSKGAELSPFPF